MTDEQTMKALNCCQSGCCGYCPMSEATDCTEYLAQLAIDLIQRQQKTINLLQKGSGMELLRKAFRAEFEEKMELGIEDCVNWADWLDSIAKEVEEGKYDDR